MRVRGMSVGNRDLPLIDEAVPLAEADASLIEELRAVLVKHGAERRLGVTLLHRHFDVGPDEIMVETTDVQQRTHVVAPVRKLSLEGQSWTATAWRLDTREPLALCVCIVQGGQHTGNHQHIPGRRIS